MGGIIANDVALLPHDLKPAHVIHQVVVAHETPSFGHDDLVRVAGRLDLLDGTAHVPRVHELALFDVDGFSGRSGRPQDMGLTAKVSRHLYEVDHFPGRRGPSLVAEVRGHGYPHRLPHFLEDRQSFLHTDSVERFQRGTAVLVVARLEDVLHPQPFADLVDLVGHVETVFFAFNGARSANHSQRVVIAYSDLIDSSIADQHITHITTRVIISCTPEPGSWGS